MYTIFISHGRWLLAALDFTLKENLMTYSLIITLLIVQICKFVGLLHKHSELRAV